MIINQLVNSKKINKEHIIYSKGIEILFRAAAVQGVVSPAVWGVLS